MLDMRYFFPQLTPVLHALSHAVWWWQSLPFN
jgi:hypothetical protein